MKLGCGYPMGPFTLLDFVGLDTTYYITHVMYDEFKERRFASPPLLKRLVMAGWYGRKSGKGFTIIRTRQIPSRISCKFRATDLRGSTLEFCCHPERSEGPMHLDAASEMHRSFAALRMTWN